MTKIKSDPFTSYKKNQDLSLRQHLQRYFGENKGGLSQIQLFNSKILLAFSLVAVLSIQIYHYHHSSDITDEVRRKYTTGFAYNLAQNFIYFYYYKGYFPIYSNADLTYSAEGAQQILDKEGESLFMECEHWTRLGENARIFAFLPNAWIDGSPKIPSIKLFNAILFTAGLISILIGFFMVKRFLIGLIFVSLLCSNPFYLYETYANQNIFGLSASTAFILLGILLPAIFSKKRRLDWIIVIFSGVLLAFVCNIRTEILPLIASPIIVYAFHKAYNWYTKIALVGFILISYSITNKTIKNYFGNKFEEAYKVVEKAGGHSYNGNKIEAHSFWHPVFCGLGDYDKKYGYTEWKDSVAYTYATPILRDSFGLEVSYTEGWHLDQYYDEEKYYYKKFDELPHYDEVIRAKVVGDIKSDPIWYVDILFKRINKQLNNTIPIGWGNCYIPLKGFGWLVLPFLFILLKVRNWEYLKLLLYFFPLMATSIVIYSGGNSTYNSPYHIILLSFLLLALINMVTLNKNKFLLRK